MSKTQGNVTGTDAGRDSAPADSVLLDVQAVANVLGCSPRHVYRLADTGKMPRPVKIGALVRWSKATIESWIAEGCKPVRTATRKAR